jgi:hypothetical protein
VRCASSLLTSKPLTIKIRKGYNDGADVRAAPLHRPCPRWPAAAAADPDLRARGCAGTPGRGSPHTRNPPPRRWRTHWCRWCAAGARRR